jgi:hypothetical protein
MNKDQVTTVNNDSDKTVNPVTLQFKRAFKDVADVFSCMKRLVEENRDRDKKSGAVMKSQCSRMASKRIDRLFIFDGKAGCRPI